MPSKTNTTRSPQGKGAPAEEKLGCWRLWVPPKNARKDARKGSHMVLGPYPVTPPK
jgi:hypothetical protein